jgi:glycosyltransferase involved in cell wall biosynthesis
MKTNRKEIVLESSSTSINILKTRIDNYFKNKLNLNNSWHIDHASGKCSKELNHIKDDEDIDLIMYGSFLRGFLQSGNWIYDNYKLWVLGNAAKSVMTNTLNIPSENIKVIPRYEIFECNSENIPDASKAIDFVYAGRISATKNLEFICALVSFLQTTFKLNINLKIFGDYDDRFHENMGRRIHTNYKDKLHNFIESLKWVSKPVFMGNLKSDEWTEANLDQPILVNMSTFIFDDFGVSVAQAQEKGWPVLLSDWGGHVDVTKGIRKLFNPSWIGHSHEAPTIITAKAKVLANEINQILQTKSWDEQEAIVSIDDKHESIKLNKIDEIRRENIKKIGPEVHLLNLNDLSAFADTEAGNLLFNNYEKNFKAKKISKKIICISHDLDDLTNKVDQEGYQDVCEFLESLSYSEETEIELISSKNLFVKKNMASLLKADQVYLSTSLKENPKIEEFFNNVIKRNIEFLTC